MIWTYGREPRLPIDLAFRLDFNTKKQSLPKYIDNLRERLRTSYELAADAAEQAKRKQKTQYDLKARGAVIQPGDRVLLKIVKYDGKHKLADKWEEIPYTVLKQPNPDIPVYDVKRIMVKEREKQCIEIYYCL